jgi:hypothetical protein
LTTHQGSSADYSDRESQWENGLDLALHRARSEFKVVGGIDLQDLKYNLTITQGRRLRLGCESSYQPTTADSLHLNLQAIRYRFDTPDLTDLNDRDELRYLLKAGWSHQIISTLSMDWDATVDLNHLVYLFRPRSSENRWARLFSIECALPWKDDPLTNVARFAVVANYTAYDFAPSDLELSRAYRSFTAEDSLTLSLSRGWTIEFETSLLKDDNGRMRWDEWVQNVSEDGYAVTTTGMLSHRIAFFQTALGWSRYFRRTDLHSANGERTPGQWVESRGPVFACFQNADQRGLSWNFQGRWLWVEDRPHGDYTLPDIKLILDYTW